MRWVVFLRGVNVGGANLCRPAEIARRLAEFGVVNIGAAGTFIVREEVSEPVLRAALERELPIKCEIMVCPARDLLKLTASDPFAGQPEGADVVRFVSVLARPLRPAPALPITLPTESGWLLKVFAIRGRFLLGLYRRQMKAISLLGKLEKSLGVPVTTRNWNTIAKIAKALS